MLYFERGNFAFPLSLGHFIPILYNILFGQSGFLAILKIFESSELEGEPLSVGDGMWEMGVEGACDGLAGLVVGVVGLQVQSGHSLLIKIANVV